MDSGIGDTCFRNGCWLGAEYIRNLLWDKPGTLRRVLSMQIINGLLLFFFILSSFTSAQKTDIIVMENGDHITGELKKMEYALITFTTDDMGTLSIEWEKIKHIISEKFFDIDSRDGTMFLGSLDTTSSREIMLVKSEYETKYVFKDSVVSINQLKSTFWDIITGSVSLGVNYTKSTQTGQWNLSGNGNYRTKRFNTSLNLNSIITFQEKEESARKQDLSLAVKRFLPNKWLLSAGASLEQNTELGIQLRTSINAGGGYALIQSNTNLLWGIAGLSVNRETYTDTTDVIFNLEGVAQMQYQIFIYDHPKTSLTTFFNIHPGITDWGRIRANYDITLDWEILSDLYWDLSFYFSYDNRPSGTASSTDYGITTAFKYNINK